LSWSPNDSFSGAQFLPGPVGDFQTAAGNNTGATAESGEPVHNGNGGGHSIWYTWTAPATGNAEFTTLANNYDTIMAVYTGNSVSNLTLVGSNDDFNPPNRNSQVLFRATKGTTYRIAVDGLSIQQGSFVLRYALRGPDIRIADASKVEGNLG